MEIKTMRKTDRRTLYTKKVIKDALLELMHSQYFEKVTVTSVCKQAEVTRATFYLHFDDLTGVLDEILEEALQLTENISNYSNENLRQILISISNGEQNLEKLKECDSMLPSCQRMADSPKYRVLFLDESLSNYIIKKFFQYEKEKMVPLLMQDCNLPQKKAEMMFLFIIYGSFSVNKKLGWKKDDEWYAMQGMVIRFVFGGMDALR